MFFSSGMRKMLTRLSMTSTIAGLMGGQSMLNCRLWQTSERPVVGSMRWGEWGIGLRYNVLCWRVYRYHCLFVSNIFLTQSIRTVGFVHSSVLQTTHDLMYLSFCCQWVYTWRILQLHASETYFPGTETRVVWSTQEEEVSWRNIVLDFNAFP